jgi:predicted NAD/FAD-dependent oxidoreductase
VLLATPAGVALRLAAPLLTTPERELLSRARTAPAVVLHAALERAPAARATRVLLPAAAELPVAWLDLAPGGTHAPQSGGLATLVAAPAWSREHLDASDDALLKELSSLLARLVPGSARELRLARVTRHADAFPLFPVGRYRELARFRRIQADRRALGRRLYFAGDHLAEPTLEGAARSALRAASDIAADLGC